MEKVNFNNQKVLIRVDYDKIFNSDNEIDTKKIEVSVPTIKYILDHGARVVTLISHFGRPNGRSVSKLSLSFIVPYLEKALRHKVYFFNDCIGEEILQACDKPGKGSVFLLENLRFHPEEEGKGIDESGKQFQARPEEVNAFCKILTSLATVYVNDAFGTVHTTHASVVGINAEKRVAGLQLKKELKFLGKAVANPERPFIGIFGGTRVKEKLRMIQNLLPKMSHLIIAGEIAFTFFKVMQIEIGDNFYDESALEAVTKVIKFCEDKNIKFILPLDYVITDKVETPSPRIASMNDGIPDGFMGLDCGPNTLDKIVESILEAKMVFWNGPIGMYEFNMFSRGSKILVETLIKATKSGCITIAAGAETTACCAKYNALDELSHVTDAGDACLQFLEGSELPGVSVLTTS